MYAATAMAEVYDINFHLINLNSVGAEDESRIQSGVHFFNSLLQQHCGFSLSSRVVRHDLQTNSDIFINSNTTAIPVGGTRPYHFRFYQQSMYNLTIQNQLSQANNEVGIFLTPSLKECGFAFPEVQLDNRALNPHISTNALVFPWVRNRIIMAAPSSNRLDCANSNRFVAHELAHIFIQDAVAHSCWDEAAQAERNCPPSNILATVRLIYPNAGAVEPQVLPAHGTGITPHQCDRIRGTIQRMLSH